MVQLPDESTIDLHNRFSMQGLRESDLDQDPFRQFRAWLDIAVAAKLREPYAMTLATATPDGKPSARMVLLRGVDERGFVFFTNFDSRKGQELAVNPWAALVIFWVELGRQVRIEGRVERVTAEESDAYFQGRPRGSRISARASDQSRVLPTRAVLEQRVQELTAEFAGKEVPRPPNWGGYRVLPQTIEFWQNRDNRLHDRLRYQRDETGAWSIQRLAP
jgi:pyridoxamine 5'-phosphate oxidase